MMMTVLMMMMLSCPTQHGALSSRMLNLYLLVTRYSTAHVA